jgi:hypothetical protein
MKRKLVKQIKNDTGSPFKKLPFDNSQPTMFDKFRSKSINRKPVEGGRKVKMQPTYKEKHLPDDFNVGILMPEVEAFRNRDDALPAYSTAEEFDLHPRDLPNAKIKRNLKTTISPR